MEEEIVFSEPEYRFPKVDDKSRHIIKVIGVGGGGGNAVLNMYRQNVKNVSYAIMNTDSQILSNSDIPTKLSLGKSGLGVGGVPELGKEAAEFSVNDIKKLLDDGTKMVFITAGMGGGTGTGAAPVIARVAREMGILTVGIVTIPFKFEKRLRIEKALRGVEEMKKCVDSLLVINNERLLEIYNDDITTVEDAFLKADDVLTVATRSIAEIITIKGKVNRDFCDVQAVMKDGGGAIVSEGRAEGENRILKAMRNALQSPLFNKVEIEKAQRLLYVIYQSHDAPIKITELTEINMFMENLSSDLEVLWGLYWDDSIGNQVKVTLIATGFDKEREMVREQQIERDNATNKLMDWYYGDSTQPVVHKEQAAEQAVGTSIEGKEQSPVTEEEKNTNVAEPTSDEDEDSNSDNVSAGNEAEIPEDEIEEKEDTKVSWIRNLMSHIEDKLRTYVEEDEGEND